MRKYNIQILGLCESRWNGSGMTTLSTKEKILYSGHPSEEHEHTLGVAIMMPETTAKALIEWEPVSERIISARFQSKGRKVTFI